MSDNTKDKKNNDCVKREKKITRRGFLKASTISTVGLALSSPLLTSLKFIPDIENPLEHYPEKGWEKIYRDQYKHDFTYHFLCAPNDTHNCLLKGYVKNGVITRIGPSYGYGKAQDVYGNQASSRWEPRLCQKGLALVRRIYGPRRIQGAMVREGFYKWYKSGFEREANGRPPKKYHQRGKENFIKLPWDEAFEVAASAMINIATTYSGDEGKALLEQQGNYDPDSIAAMNKAGTQAMKFRGGMPMLGVTRVFGMYRLANSMALVDTHVRGVSKDEAIGGRGFDNYTFHTDLPPGHPMVTGQQTVDWDLVSVEHTKLVIAWGMNWISTKMPDAHWLTEARLKGTKVISVTVEYSSVACKSDEVIIIRPASDPAFSLGLAHVIMRDKLYDEEYVESFTDLPLLVRMDTLKLLSAEDVIADFQAPAEHRDTVVMKAGESAPPPIKSGGKQHIPESLINEWGNFVVWDKNKNEAVPITRDDVHKYFKEKGIKPELEFDGELQLLDGETVKVRSVYSLTWEYIRENFDPETTSKITWAPEEAIESLAKQIADNQGQTLIAVGMGPNQFFNGDLKDRTMMLVCALTRNIGTHSGNVGSYAGNYRASYFDGIGQYILEDPFNIQLDPDKKAPVKGFFKFESAHYYNHLDKPLRVGNKNFTGKTHMPTPTKSLMFCNANSILGNLKGHYQAVVHTLPNIEFISVADWWWSTSCEYGDIVWGVDSWAEFQFPDITASVTNPFVQMFPRSSIKRLHDTRSDIQVQAGISKALGKLLNDNRFKDYWEFIHQGNAQVYLQRILDTSSMMRGYQIAKLEEDAKQGIPALIMSRTYPKIVGWEQANEGKQWYNKTGRLEFYRDEDEFIEYGENLTIHRETVDGTEYEPNAIVAKPHPAIQPFPPEKYDIPKDDRSSETRQVRNDVLTPEELLKSAHPLKEEYGYTHVYITPKYRHGAHTLPVDTDVIAMLFGPFGNPHRTDKRMPWVGEAYVDINPEDAKALGIEDGDYVWVDADPEDRPYHGEKKEGSADYKLSRLMLRARYYYGIPPSISRTWFHMYGSSYGSVEGHETNEDGLARNPRTGYQSLYRYGSHQSCTRGWLRPTLMTDSIIRKGTVGQVIGKGFAPDVYCTNGAPRDSFVKFTKAEDGGINGGTWRPAKLGLRPTYASEAMKTFMKGGFVK